MAIAAPQQPHNAVPLQPVFCLSASRTSVVYQPVVTRQHYRCMTKEELETQVCSMFSDSELHAEVFAQAGRSI